MGVRGGSGASNLGGLVGYNGSPVAVSLSYALGAVSTITAGAVPSGSVASQS